MHSYYEYSSMGLSHVTTVDCVPKESKYEVTVRAVTAEHAQRLPWFTSGFE